MSARNTCPFCGAPISAEARYCDRCGTPLTGPQISLSRRRTRTPRRIAVWAFLLILCLVLGVGLTGGYFYKAPPTTAPALTGSDTTPPSNGSGETAPPPLKRNGGTEEYLRSVVSISAKGVTGSGFIIDNKGHVVTSQHVVRDATCVTVTDDIGTPHQGIVVHTDEMWDVALVLVPTLETWPTHLELGESGKLVSGDKLFLMATPKGGTNGAIGQQGTYDRVAQNQRIGTEQRYYRELLTLDGPNVIEGASGGPVVSASTGKAVGIVTASGGAVAIAYAVPTDSVADKLRQWLTLPSPGACATTSADRVVHAMLAAITPLSGTDGTYGGDVADGVELALRDMQLDLNRVGYDITLKRMDDQNNPVVAAEKARQAAFDQAILGVVGSWGDPATNAVAQALRDSGTVLVAPTASGDELSLQGWSHFNRLVANAGRQFQAAARFAHDDLKVRSVYLLDDGSPDGMLHAKSFNDAAQLIDLAVAGRSQVGGSTDYADLARKVTASGAHAIYSATRRDPALKAIQGLRQNGVNLPIIGSDVLYDQRFEAFAGVYFTGLTVEASTMFQNHFESVWGKPTKGYAHYGYYSARVILEALVRYGEQHFGQLPSRKELASLVRQTRTTDATFSSNGENEASLIYVFEWLMGYPELLQQLH